MCENEHINGAIVRIIVKRKKKNIRLEYKIT